MPALASRVHVQELLDAYVTQGISPLTLLILNYWGQQLWVLFVDAPWPARQEAGELTTVLVMDPLTGATKHSRLSVEIGVPPNRSTPIWTDGCRLIIAPAAQHVCLEVAADLSCRTMRPSPYHPAARRIDEAVAFDPYSRLVYRAPSRRGGRFCCTNVDTGHTTELPSALESSVMATLLVNETHVVLLPMGRIITRDVVNDISFFDRSTSAWVSMVVRNNCAAPPRLLVYNLPRRGAAVYRLRYDNTMATVHVWRCSLQCDAEWQCVASWEGGSVVAAFSNPEGFILISGGGELQTPAPLARQFHMDTGTWSVLPHVPRLPTSKPIAGAHVVL
jgi:hypothetical protein